MYCIILHEHANTLAIYKINCKFLIKSHLELSTKIFFYKITVQFFIFLI